MNQRNETSENVGNKVEQEILSAIRKIRYGSVEIVVHDSRVVQIESREKFRLVIPSNENKKGPTE
jgi:hypothetical protein